MNSASHSFPFAAVLWSTVCLLSGAGDVVADEPLSPATAVARALARSPSLVAASAAETEAALSARQAESALHPEAWLSTSPGYAAGPPGGAAGRLPAIATVEVRQTLYDRARKADALEADAQRILRTRDVETAREDVARAAIQAYSRCWVDARFVADAVSREEAATSARARIQALEREGRVTALDVERGALREAEVRQLRLDHEADRDLDEWELRQLVGWPSTAPLLLTADPLDAIPGSTADDNWAAARRNDVTAARLREASAVFDRIGAIRSRVWTPMVDVDAQYSRLVRTTAYDELYRTFKVDDWSVGMLISVPLFTGGRTAASVARARAEADRLEGQRNARLQQLESLVRRAESTLARGTSALSLKKRAEGVAEEDLRLGRALAAEHRLDPADLEARQMALADARDEVGRAQLDLVAARVALLALRGDLLSIAGGTAGVSADSTRP